MRRILILFIVLFSTAILSNYKSTTPVGAGATFKDVSISYGFKPYVMKFYNIIHRNDIEIDWSKISSISVVPLARGTQGIYSPDTRVILIQPFQFASLSTKAYNNLLLIILAHEVGHSQGFKHSTERGKLMSSTDAGVYDILNDDNLVEEFIILAFIGR